MRIRSVIEFVKYLVQPMMGNYRCLAFYRTNFNQIFIDFSASFISDCTFEDFLDMMSVFSDATPKIVKAEHAFRIFGMQRY